MKTQISARLIVAALLMLVTVGLSLAQETPPTGTTAEAAPIAVPAAPSDVIHPAPPPLKQIDKGDTAWMLVSSLLPSS